MENHCILALDLGGSYIKAALIRPDGGMAGESVQVPARSDAALGDILDSWRQTLVLLFRQAAALALVPQGVGISIPGPFDFKEGKSLMGQKYQAIYGLPIAGLLREQGLPSGLPVRFIQDANAFLAGEQLCGAARGYDCCAGVTLGTGLGFTAMADGDLLTNGFGAPYIALYRQPYGGGVLEDALSARGLCNAYLHRAGLPPETAVNAKEVGELAKMGDPAALLALEELGRVLGSQTAYLLTHTRCRCLVLGGQISKDFPLFEPALREALSGVGCLERIAQAAHPQDAALYGAASLYYK